MVCPKCGTLNDANAVFCKVCHSPLLGFKQNLYKVDPKERKVKKIKIGLLFFFVLILVGSLGYGYYYFDQYYQKEQVLNRFCEDLQHQQIDKAMRILDLPKSEFITNESLTKLLAASTCQKSSNQLISGDLKIDYTMNTKGKYYYLFDRYVIQLADIIIKEWEIKVPIKGKLFINNQEIASTLIHKSDTYYDYYLLKNVLNTTYEVIIEHDLFEPVKKEVLGGSVIDYQNIMANDYSFLTNYLVTTYQISLQGKSFNEIKPYVTETLEKQFLIKIEYYKDDIRTYLRNQIGLSVDFLNLQFQEINIRKMKLIEPKVDAAGSIFGTIEYDLEITYYDMADRTNTLQFLNVHETSTAELVKDQDTYRLNNIRM